MSKADYVPASVPTDEQLLDRFLTAGDQKAFSELYTRHHGPLKTFLQRRGMDECTADEKAHEALTTVATRLDQYDRSRPLSPYLLTIAANLVIDERRDARRRPAISLNDIGSRQSENFNKAIAYEPADYREQPASYAMSIQEDYKKIKKGIAKLEKKYRDVIWLRYFARFNDSMGAKKLGIPRTTFERRAQRAARLLGLKISDGLGHDVSDITAA